MSELFEKIKRLVREQRYLIGEHASERLEERGMLEWQVVYGIETASLLRESPRAKPNASVETEQMLTDGTAVKAVWSYVDSIDYAKLVTVHYFDEA